MRFIVPRLAVIVLLGCGGPVAVMVMIGEPLMAAKMGAVSLAFFAICVGFVWVSERTAITHQQKDVEADA